MYKQIIPAAEWFYVEHSKIQDNIVVYYIAAWALTDAGHIIGLISVHGSHTHDKGNNMARLVTVPPTGSGQYKHRVELSENECKALENNGYLEKLCRI